MEYVDVVIDVSINTFTIDKNGNECEEKSFAQFVRDHVPFTRKDIINAYNELFDTDSDNDEVSDYLARMVEDYEVDCIYLIIYTQEGAIRYKTYGYPEYFNVPGLKGVCDSLYHNLNAYLVEEEL